MKSNKQIRVVGYVRVSTEEQSREGISLDAQAARLEDYARSQGWTLSQVYSDDCTGTTLRRPSLQRLLSDIDGGAVDAVLVYKLDRLARSQRLTLQLLEEVFQANGVDLKSVTEPFDTGTAMGMAFLGMLAVFAQLERDTIAERTKHSLAHKKKLGEHVGRVPFGYQIGSTGKLEKVPEEQRVIARMKRLRRRGHSLRSIATASGQSLGSVARILQTHRPMVRPAAD